MNVIQKKSTRHGTNIKKKKKKKKNTIWGGTNRTYSNLQKRIKYCFRMTTGPFLAHGPCLGGDCSIRSIKNPKIPRNPDWGTLPMIRKVYIILQTY